MIYVSMSMSEKNKRIKKLFNLPFSALTQAGAHVSLNCGDLSCSGSHIDLVASDICFELHLGCKIALSTPKRFSKIKANSTLLGCWVIF